MNPNVFIEPIALADILLAVDLNAVEISGLCQVERIEDSYTIRGEPLILDQTCSHSHTDFLPAYTHWVHEMMREERGPEINTFRLWWHSHGYNRVYFSDTDEATIRSWQNSLDEWWLSLVANKWGRMKIRLDIFNPYEEREREIVIPCLKMTERKTEEEMREIMCARKARMNDIIARNVHVEKYEESRPFETILWGLYHEPEQTEHHRRR